jgi:glycosyltransferase involved in cell wall biosynthesis
MFSIYILTYNEERDIAACIESALLSDDVIVVDSCSRDRTREIAAQYPVRVVEHPFESHGKQRTWMLENIPAKHDWAYILEADERMTPALFQECLAAMQKPDTVGLLRGGAGDVYGPLDSPQHPISPLSTAAVEAG